MVCYRDKVGPIGPRSFTQVGLAPSLGDQSSNFLELLYVVLVVTISDPLHEKGEYFQAACTGTLITKNLVLSVANCIQMDDYNDPYTSSTTVFKRPNETLRALRIFVYPDYTKRMTFNVAIIMVEKSLISNFPLLPEGLQRFTSSRLATCVLSGYGEASAPNVHNFRLIRLSTTKTNLISCRTSNRAHVCLHFEKIMPCSGDMGSALICGDTLVAIYTPSHDPGKNSEKCMNIMGSVFTPVTAIRPWMERIIKAPHTNLQWLNNPFYILLLSVAVLTVTAVIYYGLVELMHRKYRPMFDGQTPRASPSQSYLSPTSSCSTIGSDKARARRPKNEGGLLAMVKSNKD